jgi:uncharacterized protein affecting Mg2+/Co2+ transport
MPKLETRIERGALKTVARSAVGAGLLFRLKKKDGSEGDVTYASIGRNGKFYSINIATGALASTENGDKPVTVVGKYKWVTDIVTDSARRVNKTRGDVAVGEMFVVSRDAGDLGGKTAYVAIGKNNSGKFLAVNLVSGDYAVTDNARKAVVVIGSGRIEGSMV